MVKAQETLQLQFPIKHGQQEITSVTMRRPKVRDTILAQKAGGEGDADAELALFASLTGLTPDQLQDMDLADYVSLQGIYKGFLSSAPAKSGPPASPSPATPAGQENP